MQPHRRFKLSLLCSLIIFAFSGCGDTTKQIEEMKRGFLEKRVFFAKNLKNRLESNPNAFRDGDISIFVSSQAFTEALKLLDGFEMPLPQRKDVIIKIKEIRPTFSDGLAAVELKASATKGSLVINVEGNATLFPEFFPSHVELPEEIEVVTRQEVKININLKPLLKILPQDARKNLKDVYGLVIIPRETRKVKQVLYKPKNPMGFKLVVDRLEPKVSWGPFSMDLKDFAAEFAQLKVNEELSTKLPRLEIPLENFLKVERKAENREIPILKDHYIGAIALPRIYWGTGIVLSEPLFLSNGIQFMASFKSAGSATPGPFTTLPFSPTNNAKNLDELIKELENIRKQTEPLLKKVSITDADLAVWIRGQSIANLVNSINTLPKESRSILFYIVRATGNGRFEDNDTYFLELRDLRTNKVQGELKNIKATWTNQGNLEISSDISLRGHCKVHGELKKPVVEATVGFDVSCDSNIKALLVCERDPDNFIKASVKDILGKINYSINTSIKDKKEWCWKIKLGPIEGKDCKTLWDYEIPINYSDSVTIDKKEPIEIPLVMNLPKEINLTQRIGGVPFQRSAQLTVASSGFVKDQTGMLVKVILKLHPTENK